MARIWMTNRHGFHPASSDLSGSVVGRSHPPYDSLNLGLKVGDDLNAVQSNRKDVAAACGLDEIIFMDQVHSALMLDGSNGGEQVCDGIFLRRESVLAKGKGLAVQVADCVPMVITHSDVNAAVHIGREGLLKGMTESAIVTLAKSIDLRGAKAWLGPSICGNCYQVSAELFSECETKYPASVHSRFNRQVDVAKGVISILDSKGVEWGWFGGVRECVSCEPEYYSYRRDGVTGRQAMIVAW
jgi:hypothetical protein